MPATNYQAPGFLQSRPWQGLQQFNKQQVPGLFDTSDLAARTEAAISSQMGQSRALAAAAGAAYSNRAAQSGASGLGAGFAQAQAMLPAYAQANQMRMDLAGKQLQSRQAQAGLQGDLYSRIGQMLGARQGQLSDWFGNQDRMKQQQTQFNADIGFRNRALQQEQSQFDAQLGQRQNEFNVTSGQNNFQNRLQALSTAMRMPRQSYSYSLTNSGTPRSGADSVAMLNASRQNNLFSNIQNQLYGLF